MQKERCSRVRPTGCIPVHIFILIAYGLLGRTSVDWEKSRNTPFLLPTYILPTEKTSNKYMQRNPKICERVGTIF